MKTYHALLVLAALTAPLFSGACASDPLTSGSGAAGRSEGGRASSVPIDTNPNVAYALPGSDAMALQFRNSDTTSNPVAGDAPLLVLGGGGAVALQMLSRPDPIADAITEQYHHAQEELAAAEALDERDFWIARADAQIQALAAHEKDRLEAAKGIAGDFSSLQTIVFYVVSMRLAGVPPDRLPEGTVMALAKGISEAIKPALEGAN